MLHRTIIPGLLWLLLGLVTATGQAVSGNLVFPKQGAAAKDAIVKDCPTCMASGVTLCGTADVKFAKRLGASYFFAGQPKRGYLPAFRLSGEEFRALARSMTYDAMMQSLKQSFEALPLVVIDSGFAATRVLPTPKSVDIAFPQTLHQCVSDKSKPWGCCIAADCQQECCEKSLGSPAVAVHWDDATTGDKLTFHFSHTLGASTLTRETTAGKTFVYWCIAEEPGLIQ
jgi:hypothetical protein